VVTSNRSYSPGSPFKFAECVERRTPMSKSAHPLDNINIKSPCDADWDSMKGNDVVRFCTHCDLNVHDLTLMTRREALALVRSSDGRLCLRFRRRADGTIETAAPYQKLHLIKRRAARLAAGAFGATLSIAASVAAQTPAPPVSGRVISELPYRASGESDSFQEGGRAVLTGIVLDPQKAVAPGASVTLINESTKAQMMAVTNEEGQYRFQTLAGGSYTLIAQSTGFVRGEIRGVNVPTSGEQKQDVALEAVALNGDVVIVVTPSDPLLKAVVFYDVAAVKELIAAGADVNVLDKEYNSTPLAEAVERGNQEMVEALLSARADVDMENSTGDTAILSLGGQSTGEIVRALVAAGAKINDCNDDGGTPLQIAATLNNTELLQTLIGLGANLNDRNNAGQTALMLAAREGRLENVRALLDAGASPYVKDSEGWTALKYARDNSHADIARLLNAYGVLE
jgi:hypothetical protein